MSNHTPPEGHLLEIMRRGLEVQLKEKLTEHIVQTRLTEYEKIIREEIKPLVEKISIPKVVRLQEFLRFRDELHVVVNIQGENP